MIEMLKNVEQRLREELPGAKIELHCFDGGGAMLDVIFQGELFVLEYQPPRYESADRAFGISKVRDAEPFTRGHDAFFEKLEDAEKHLHQIIKAETK